MRTRSFFSTFARGAALALPLVAALSATAHAQEGPQRALGFGSTFGAGGLGAGIIGLGGTQPVGFIFYPMLPTLEFKYFIQPHDFSIDVSVPLTNIIIGSAAAHAFYFNVDAMFNANLGHGSVRGIMGAGLGLDVLAGGGGGAFGIRVPGEIGMEVLAAHNHFGFELMARPFFEVVPAGGSGVIGGGALLVLGFMGYTTNEPAHHHHR
jgi:hypothetical protein